MKPWEAWIRVYEDMEGGWHFRVQSDAHRPKTHGIAVVAWNGTNPYETEIAARRAARRVMKRLGLVERRAKAGKVH